MSEFPASAMHSARSGSFRVRSARAEDGAALGALDRDTWSTLHAVAPEPVPPYDPFFDSTHRPEHYLVAEEVGGVGGVGETEGAEGGGELLGYIRLVPPTPLACNRHVRQIQGLAVAEAARGRGVARELLHGAYDEARRQGAARMTLRVLGHNAPARALYESEGFTVEGVLPGEFHLGGEYVDDVLMGRRLD
ncbi:GNAT family N-acetyltransferase [Streptomyces sp. NPDC094448]|uniref:GNAT family N-acetyltransferase n=1 Tax=Streptomyces sp. NPDC094448 TaxID=3366063 RepID=UPI0037F15FAA